MYLMAELTALLTGAGFAALPNTGWLRVTGPDRVRWLNGMVTNSITALAPGEGCYNFVLNAQGRIQGDLTAFLLDDAILLETTQPTEIAILLDKFIIMDDVELEILSGGVSESELPQPDGQSNSTRTGLLLAGPDAPAMLTNMGLPNPDPIQIRSATFNERPVDVIAAYSPIVPRFELWAAPETVDALTDALLAAGAVSATSDDIEQLRILEGTPQYGRDIRDRDLPQETNQTRALHFNKGCYLGQEIVERIRSRGQVHRIFSGLLLTGELSAPGTPLTADSDGAKPVGEITSVTALDHPSAGRLQLALGYIRREFLPSTPGAPPAVLHYAGGAATPVTLPFTASGN